MIKQLLKTFFPFGLFMQMPILETLLGSPSEQRTDPATVYGPQAQFFQQFYPELTSLFQQGIQDPSSVLPGFTPTELAGQQAALQTAGSFAPTLGAATRGIEQLFGAADTMSPLITGAVEAATAPLFQQFQNVVAPGIRRAAGGAGRTGDPKAARLAAQDLFRQVGDISKGIALPAYQSGLQAIQGGIGALPTLFGAALQPSEVQRQIGAEERAMQTRQSPFGIIDLFRQAAGAPIVLSGGSSATGAGPGLADLFQFGITKTI